MSVDLFGEVPKCATVDALGILIHYARRHRSEPFSPEDVIHYAGTLGIYFEDGRQWGAVFKQGAKEGYIRRAGLFPRASSNHSMRPGWVGV